MIYSYFILIFAIGLAVWVSIVTRKLTVAAAVIGGILALVIYAGVGLYGLFMLGAFFILGTLATAWQTSSKNKIGLAEKKDGRTVGQVFANGGVAGIVSLLALRYPENHFIWATMIAGSLSAATADTLSSELGSVYGKHFYNCITFKKDQRGLDGVVSLEGVLIGIMGSTIIACIYCIGFGWDIAWLAVAIAGTIGNLADSVLGATLERKGILPNDVVNFLNTAMGALSALALITAFQS